MRLLFLFLSIILNGYSQNSYENTYSFKKGQFVDLTSYLPLDYVEDGSIDYTSYLQVALDNNTMMLMPNFPVAINSEGLEVKSNSIIIFQLKSSLVMLPNAKEKYRFFNIVNKNNIELINPRLIGDRYKHSDTKGEWGMGINILGSESIDIINPYIKECWGDGIYVGHSKSESKKIRIRGGDIIDNRRNGISVISVDGFVLDGVNIGNSNGADPQSGLDFEPNYIFNVLKDIQVLNLNTFNNKKNGVVINLTNFQGAENYVEIYIKNWKDSGSTRPLYITGKNKVVKNIVSIKGLITIKNYVFQNNKLKFFTGDSRYLPTLKL